MTKALWKHYYFLQIRSYLWSSVTRILPTMLHDSQLYASCWISQSTLLAEYWILVQSANRPSLPILAQLLSIGATCMLVWMSANTCHWSANHISSSDDILGDHILVFSKCIVVLCNINEIVWPISVLYHAFFLLS